MRELLMQIEVNEIKTNRKICYDDIVNLKVKNNKLTIKDDIGWKTTFEINENVELKINFDYIIPF